MRTLRDRTRRILEDPTRNDPVYKVVQRLFRDDTACNLSREKDARFRVRRLAAKRFILGYPPRKDSDTAIGDAVNWEWIVRCASDTSKDIVVVSRDSDFGVVFEGEAILNDWLRQEFHDRVSRTRSITLTTRLAEGFRAAGIRVTRKETEAEEEFLKKRTILIAGRAAATSLGFASLQASGSVGGLLDSLQASGSVGRLLDYLTQKTKLPPELLGKEGDDN